MLLHCIRSVKRFQSSQIELFSAYTLNRSVTLYILCDVTCIGLDGGDSVPFRVSL